MGYEKRLRAALLKGDTLNACRYARVMRRGDALAVMEGLEPFYRVEQWIGDGPATSAKRYAFAAAMESARGAVRNV